MIRILRRQRYNAAGMAAALFLVLTGLQPAQATQSISCQATNGSGAGVDILLGAGPRLVPIEVTVAAGGQVWTTVDDRDGTKVVIYQTFDDGELLAIDLTDDNVLEIVATIRLIRGEEGKSFEQVGILTVAGAGAHPLSCEGP